MVGKKLFLNRYEHGYKASEQKRCKTKLVTYKPVGFHNQFAVLTMCSCKTSPFNGLHLVLDGGATDTQCCSEKRETYVQTQTHYK